jgi:ABC-type multidrug transport system fused ATPase/permease subunit
VVLDRGRAVQVGTHAELKSRPGLYRTLWEIQSRADEEASHG